MRRWTPKAAIARSQRHLEHAAARLANVALEWGDVDQSYVDEAEDFIRELREFGQRMEREVAERIAAGEHVGI